VIWLTAALGIAAPRTLSVTMDGPVKLGEWRRAPMGLIFRQFDAKPGEVYRIEVRWADPKGTFVLEAWSGALDEGDIDDASSEMTVPKVGSVSGSAHLKIGVRPSGNAVWFRVQPTGDPKQMLEYRILASQGMPKDEIPAPGSWGIVPRPEPPLVKQLP
jgi:hypothetical protein